jgi:hypothetical protein
MPDQQEARERPRGGIHISEGGGGALAAMEAKQKRYSDKVHAQERVLELCFQRRGACAWRPGPCWPPQGAVMAVHEAHRRRGHFYRRHRRKSICFAANGRRRRRRSLVHARTATAAPGEAFWALAAMNEKVHAAKKAPLPSRRGRAAVFPDLNSLGFSLLVRIEGKGFGYCS